MSNEIKVMNNDETRDFCIKKDLKIFELEQEIERLNNIINEAIEYIDWQRRNPQYDNVWRNSECESLIEILKGE